MSEHAATITRPPHAGVSTHETRAAEYHLHADSAVNVGGFERALSVLGGGALALYGLRRSLPGLMLMLGGGVLMYRGFTGHCPAYQAMDLNTASQDPERGITLEATITVNKPAAEVYRFWRQVENHPRFMQHLEAAVSTGEKRSHWVARGPLHMPLARLRRRGNRVVGMARFRAKPFTWDAELVEERDNALLTWRSLPGADVDNSATVRLRELPNSRGTEVRLKLAYAPPGGVAGLALAKLFKTLTVRELREALRHFKHIIEAGETPTIAHQPAAPASRRQPAGTEREVSV